MVTMAVILIIMIIHYLWRYYFYLNTLLLYFSTFYQYHQDRNYTRGYDFRKNLDVNYEGNGTYATDLFTNEAVRLILSHNQSQPLFLMLSHLAPHTGNDDDPFQAPQDEINKFQHIVDPKRRIYAGNIVNCVLCTNKYDCFIPISNGITIRSKYWQSDASFKRFSNAE